MMSLAITQAPDTFVLVKTENAVHWIEMQQSKVREVGVGGCHENKCVIF
jgi:hypothetical protein